MNLHKITPAIPERFHRFIQVWTQEYRAENWLTYHSASQRMSYLSRWGSPDFQLSERDIDNWLEAYRNLPITDPTNLFSIVED